jgi:hypothetical protein
MLYSAYYAVEASKDILEALEDGRDPLFYRVRSCSQEKSLASTSYK